MIKILVITMFLQVLFPFITLYLLFKKRVRAMKRKDISPHYFKTYTGAQVMADDIVVFGRHYTNQFEMPILFLIVTTLFIAMNMVDSVTIIMSVSFVIARFIHSIVHLNGNNVFHRFKIFGLGCLILLSLWFYLLGKIFLMN